MGKERLVACIHYKCHGTCGLGKAADFYGLCQTCPSYKKLKGGKLSRTDNRRKKMDKIMKKERYD